MRGVAWVLAVAFMAGAAVYLLVARRGRRDDQQLRAELTAAIERGTFADLGRAQAIGRRLVVADPHDREAAAPLALADAMLAVDYGAETAREAARVLDEAGLGGVAPAGDATTGMAAAARALVRLRGGDLAGAVAAAAALAAQTPDLPHALYALGRARARTGDLTGAARALEAAIVAAPGFAAARVAWAEAALDLGDPRNGAIALGKVLGQAPDDPRGLLLLQEAGTALGQPGFDSPDVCRPGARTPPFVGAACALARASGARRAGLRTDARALADAAGRLAPDEPRLLGRAALLLAQLGAVDQSAALVARAGKLAAPNMPAVAWAAAALKLGRGRIPAPVDDRRPWDPEARLLVARTALASGGVAALLVNLSSMRPADIEADADLKALRALVTHTPVRDPDGDPLRAYVAGLQADLTGEPRATADRLTHALAGHGDACRAAGEYVSALRALKLRPPPEAFAGLRSENTGCVNLPRR